MSNKSKLIIKYCPRCESGDIFMATHRTPIYSNRFNNEKTLVGYTKPYTCTKCGYNWDIKIID